MSNNIPLFVMSFNCGKKTPLCADFTDELHNELPDELCNVYVFGFQELSSILDSTYDLRINKKLIGLSNNIIDCLESKYGLDSFEVVSISHFGAIGMLVLSPFMSRINTIKNSIGYPIGYFYTNLKGATGIRFKFDSTEFTFVCMHLNAGEKAQHMFRRNEDLFNILSRLEFDDGWGILKPKTHCFLLGDLNYRTTGTFGIMKDIENLSVFENDQLLKLDEFLILRNNGILLCDFEEPEIKFKPTYKYHIGTKNYDKGRKPSWCDRIIYLGYSEFSKLPKYDIIKYETFSNCLISDHLPIYMFLKVPLIPPETKINSMGFLIDRSTKLVDFSKNYKNHRWNLYIMLMSSIMSYLLGVFLYFSTTSRGKIVFLGLVILLYIIILKFM